METWIDEGWFAVASRRKRWLAGVSGGADSVALVRAMAAAGFRNVVVCHADHGLRTASGKDAEFVRALTNELDYPCEIGRLDVKARMRRTGESMETAARAERLGFFGRCAAKHRCARLVLAHHADDQAETVLWNLLRGSYGLRGMAELNNMTTEDGWTFELHRPLLGVRKACLVNWLRANGWKWREDASNRRSVAIRNRLRNEAFPLLEEITGRDVTAALCRLAEDARETAQWLAESAARSETLDPQGRLHVPSLRKLPVLVRREAIRLFLSGAGILGINRTVLDSACAMVEGEAATLNLPGGGRLRRRQGRIFIDPV
ncbi:MAG: tRNA lysidine(34) synthetase TilS [Verrucomicrobiota bacterium]